MPFFAIQPNNTAVCGCFRSVRGARSLPKAPAACSALGLWGLILSKVASAAGCWLAVRSWGNLRATKEGRKGAREMFPFAYVVRHRELSKKQLHILRRMGTKPICWKNTAACVLYFDRRCLPSNYYKFPRAGAFSFGSRLVKLCPPRDIDALSCCWTLYPVTTRWVGRSVGGRLANIWSICGGQGDVTKLKIFLAVHARRYWPAVLLW